MWIEENEMENTHINDCYMEIKRNADMKNRTPPTSPTSTFWMYAFIARKKNKRKEKCNELAYRGLLLLNMCNYNYRYIRRNGNVILVAK